MPELTSLDLALRLDPQGDELRATIPEEWLFNGRVFGGYVAALAAHAASLSAPGLDLCAFQAVYPKSTQPGEIRCSVRLLRQGSSSLVLCVELRQNDQVVFSGTCWFLLGGYERPGAGLVARPSSAPAECPPVTWISRAVPFLGHFEARAVDFPLTPDGLGDRNPRCDLWLRPVASLDGVPHASQLIDLLLCDSFLLECVFRSEGAHGVAPVSLDLQARWLYSAEPTAWRRIVTEASVTDSRSLADGTLYEVTGQRYCTTSCQGRVFRLDGN